MLKLPQLFLTSPGARPRYQTSLLIKAERVHYSRLCGPAGRSDRSASCHARTRGTQADALERLSP